jgi:adenylate kinase family enzyme
VTSPDPAASRILVYGVTGSGKTTLARQIGERTGLPWHEMDQLTWQPGWIMVPLEEQRRRVAALCAEQRWVLDTAYANWLDLVLPRVELIVALDYARWLSLGRLLRRTAARAIDKRDVCNGNQESFRSALSRDSILLWHFRSFRRKRRRIRGWAAAPPGARVVVLRSPRDTERWLRSAAGQRQPAGRKDP